MTTDQWASIHVSGDHQSGFSYQPHAGSKVSIDKIAPNRRLGPFFAERGLNLDTQFSPAASTQRRLTSRRDFPKDQILLPTTSTLARPVLRGLGAKRRGKKKRKYKKRRVDAVLASAITSRLLSTWPWMTTAHRHYDLDHYYYLLPACLPPSS